HDDISADVIEMPMRVDDGDRLLAVARRDVQHPLRMLAMPAGVDDDRALGAEEDDRVAVGLPPTGELPRDHRNPRSYLANLILALCPCDGRERQGQCQHCSLHPRSPFSVRAIHHETPLNVAPTAPRKAQNHEKPCVSEAAFGSAISPRAMNPWTATPKQMTAKIAPITIVIWAESFICCRRSTRPRACRAPRA